MITDLKSTLHPPQNNPSPVKSYYKNLIIHMNHIRHQMMKETGSIFEEHVCAMFHYILEHAEKTLYVPERIKNLSKQYALGSDEMYSWVMETYEPTDDKVFVKLKGI